MASSLSRFDPRAQDADLCYLVSIHTNTDLQAPWAFRALESGRMNCFAGI